MSETMDGFRTTGKATGAEVRRPTATIRRGRYHGRPPRGGTLLGRWTMVVLCVVLATGALPSTALAGGGAVSGTPTVTATGDAGTAAPAGGQGDIAGDTGGTGEGSAADTPTQPDTTARESVGTAPVTADPGSAAGIEVPDADQTFSGAVTTPDPAGSVPTTPAPDTSADERLWGTMSNEAFSMSPAPDFGVRSSQCDTTVHWFTTAAGDVAYCLDKGRAFRTGTVYDGSWNPRVGYWIILLDGYPCNTVLGDVSLSAEEARAATQYALWAFKMDQTAGIYLDLGSCYTVSDQGARVLAAARWLVWKAWSNPCYGIFASADEVPAYIGLSSITGSSTTRLSADGGTIVCGPFSVSSEVATAQVSVSVPGMDGWFYCTADGTPTDRPSVGQDFHIGAPRAALAPEGEATLQVAEDRMHLAALVWGEPTQTSQDMGVVYNPHAVRDTSSFPISWTQDTVLKVDDDTDAPLAGATFTLAMRTGDVWTDIGSAVTDADGRAVFGALAPGSYRVTEVQAPQTHADAAESGYTESQTFTIGPDSTGIEQVFRDRAIAISCEVHESTIALTSAAFASLPGQAGVDNVGRETYAYRIGYASTSNVRADEFTVDDPLASVGEGYVRVREIWTPTTIGDTDGRMNVWYRTDRTDTTKVYDTVCAMDTNPWNPNNPENTPQMPDTGWKLWARDVDCSVQKHLSCADLHLAEGEHLTAIRFEHGSVEEGFTTERDATYLVYAAQQLSPTLADGGETVIHDDVSAHIFRNLVLADEDVDAVQTRVIGTFSLGASVSQRTGGGLARTGDVSWPFVLGIVACAAGGGGAVLMVERRRRRKDPRRFRVF